jgi:septum formation protein
MNTRWNKLDRPLLLASKSPRRREILKNMGFAFSVQSPAINDEETFIQTGRIENSVKELACAKAQSIAAQFTSSLVLGSDTVVVIDNQVIGKPVHADNARETLYRLSGKVHTVYSGVALVCAEINFERAATACSDVFFRDLPAWEIEEYLTYDEYTDKAGAYAIQGKAMTFIDKINGCFYNVMGLPVTETIELFKAYTEFTKGYR